MEHFVPYVLNTIKYKGNTKGSIPAPHRPPPPSPNPTHPPPTVFAKDLDLLKFHPLTMGNVCAKFIQNNLNSLLFIIFTRLILYLPITTLTFDLNL